MNMLGMTQLAIHTILDVRNDLWGAEQYPMEFSRANCTDTHHITELNPLEM